MLSQFCHREEIMLELKQLQQYSFFAPPPPLHHPISVLIFCRLKYIFVLLEVLDESQVTH